MRPGCITAMLLGVGTILLWFTTTALQSLASEGLDRPNALQVPLFLLVLIAPALSYVCRRRMAQLPMILLVLQIGLYVVYETGISIQTNIRIDLLPIYPAVLVNAWIGLRAMKAGAGGAEPQDAIAGAAPAGRTRCDQCGVTYPSHYYLRAAGNSGYICEDCRAKQ